MQVSLFFAALFEAGDEAKFRAHSTCPCNFTMFYEIMGRGNLLHSGIHFARHLRKTTKVSSKVIFHHGKGDYVCMYVMLYAVYRLSLRYSIQYMYPVLCLDKEL